MYKKIINDSQYFSIMKKIDDIKFITDGKWDWEHGLGHATRVTNYVKQILTQLKFDSHIIELGMIAGMLHDIGLSEGIKKDHAKNSAEYVKHYLKTFNILEVEIDVIVQAIEDHSNGNNIQSAIGAALLMADKLDFSKYRTINSSINDYLNRQITNIDNVDIIINDNAFIINYLTDNDFDPSVLKEWKKCILCPQKAASYFKRNCIFLINGKPLDYNQIINC